MTRMTTARILMGGLLAGLIMNVGEAALHAAVPHRSPDRLLPCRADCAESARTHRVERGNQSFPGANGPRPRRPSGPSAIPQREPDS